jgi:hypothetical protein
MHDREDESFSDARTMSACAIGKAVAPVISRHEVADGMYEMVSNAPILPHSEVFNTYGEKLTNAQLLLRYGFSLDSNENDCITWEWNDLWTFAATALDGEPGGISRADLPRLESVDDIMHLYTRAVDLWSSESSAWGETGLVYTPTALTAVTNRDYIGGNPKGYTDGTVLRLNADGRISHHLWLYCAMLAYRRVVSATDATVEEVIKQLRDVGSLLTQFESSFEESDDSDDGAAHGGSALRKRLRQLFCSPQDPILQIATQTIRTILSLCRSRSKHIGNRNLSALDIGEEFDVSVLIILCSRTQTSWLNNFAP